MKFNLKEENINYLKIIYKDKEDFSHCIKTSIKRMDNHEIYSFLRTENYIFIKTPQKVELSIATDNGLYKTTTDLKGAHYEEPYLFLSLGIPDEITYFQNREFFRVKLGINAIIIYEEEESLKQVSCETYDISANGVKVILDKFIKIPENVQLRLSFNDRIIIVNAQKIRTDEEENGVFKTSFKFIDLQTADLDYISGVCLKKQMEAKRQKLI